MSNLDEVEPLVDVTPVDLDPPAPEIVRWQELADNATTLIYHGGDAEKIISFPRPPWADPDDDGIGASVVNTRYRSAVVKVASGYGTGTFDDELFAPPSVGVRAVRFGDGTDMVNVHLNKYVDGKWVTFGMNLFVEQAHELARVIDAAADLLGGSKAGRQ